MTNDNKNRFKKLTDDPKFSKSFITELRLIIRLIGDKRVPFYLKLIPFATVAYLIFPEQLLLFVDDIVVLTAGNMAFVELCPPVIVEEHRLELYNNRVGNAEDIVIDGVAEEVERTLLEKGDETEKMIILDEDLQD